LADAESRYARARHEKGTAVSDTPTSPGEEDADGSIEPNPTAEHPTTPAPAPAPAPEPLLEPEPEPEPASAKPRRKKGPIIAIVLLAVGLAAVAGVLTFALVQLDKAFVLIEEQQRELDEQRDLIDQKETFSQSATELMSTAAQFDGLPFSTMVNPNTLETLIQSGWTHRWNSAALERASTNVDEETARLAALIAEAEEQKASNGTGTHFEKVTDRLGQGFISTSLTDTDEICEQDVWGCVGGDDPYTIHYDHAETRAEPFMNNTIREGVAYHEYAHVLQFTNPAQTEKALTAFDGDWETMADCFALTYLDGWKLDHTIWVSSYEYWEVSVGYGYTCNSEQRKVIREWRESLGYQHEPISQ